MPRLQWPTPVHVAAGASPPPPTASVVADPHVTGFNGTKFSLQALGWTDLLSTPGLALAAQLVAAPVAGTSWVHAARLGASGTQLSISIGTTGITTGGTTTHQLVAKLGGATVKPGSSLTLKGISVRLAPGGKQLVATASSPATGLVMVRVGLGTGPVSKKPFLNIFVTLPGPPTQALR